MAGHRSRTTGNDNAYNAKQSTYLRRDLEQGRPSKDRKYRFRDHGPLEPDDRRREEFKMKLLDGVKSSSLEDFRKKDEEVSSIFPTLFCPFYIRQYTYLRVKIVCKIEHLTHSPHSSKKCPNPSAVSTKSKIIV